MTGPTAVSYVPVTAEEEHRHEASPDAAWKEAHFASLVSEAVSVYYEVGETPARGAADAFCGILPADGSLVFVRRRGGATSQRRGTDVDVDGFTVACQDTLRVWLATYSGPARRYADPTDLLSGTGYVQCEAEVALTLTAIADPVRLIGGMTPGIYEQPVRVTGQVAVDGTAIPVDTVGYRNHTWGARSWAADKQWLAAHATGLDGSWALSFVLSRIGGQEQGYGWLRDERGALHPVEAVRELASESRGDVAPFGDRYELDVAGTSVVARFQPDRHVPLRHREGGALAAIDEHLGGWQVEASGRARRGVGLLELLQVTGTSA